jgi:hypothetical protein
MTLPMIGTDDFFQFLDIKSQDKFAFSGLADDGDGIPRNFLKQLKGFN